MNSYGKAAIRAVQLYENGLVESPVEAWKQATTEIFDRISSRVKGCPKDTFLGLCKEGLVQGIPAGNYTWSRKNKKYAVEAVAILKQRPSLASSPSQLWYEVMQGEFKQHNSQMNVVTALWKQGLLK